VVKETVPTKFELIIIELVGRYHDEESKMVFAGKIKVILARFG
jgi:hypothetical protein